MFTSIRDDHCHASGQVAARLISSCRRAFVVTFVSRQRCINKSPVPGFPGTGLSVLTRSYRLRRSTACLRPMRPALENRLRAIECRTVVFNHAQHAVAVEQVEDVQLCREIFIFFTSNRFENRMSIWFQRPR